MKRIFARSILKTRALRWNRFAARSARLIKICWSWKNKARQAWSHVQPQNAGAAFKQRRYGTEFYCRLMRWAWYAVYHGQQSAGIVPYYQRPRACQQPGRGGVQPLLAAQTGNFRGRNGVNKKGCSVMLPPFDIDSYKGYNNEREITWCWRVSPLLWIFWELKERLPATVALFHFNAIQRLAEIMVATRIPKATINDNVS